MKNIMYFASVSDLSSGASHSLLKLASLVKRAGNKVIVVLPEHGELEEKLKSEKIKYIVIKQYIWNFWIKNINDSKNITYYLKYPLKRILNWNSQKKIEKIVKEEKIDIIHMNTLTSCMGAEVAVKNNIKLVWHIREFLDDDLGIEFCNSGRAISLIEKSDAIISISSEINKKFSEIFQNENHYIVYNGISIGDYYFSKVLFNDEKIKILSSGRIMSGKGQKDLFGALALLPKNYHNRVEVDVIGNIEEQDYYQQLLKIKKNNDLSFISMHGFQEDSKPFLKNADILCVCSKKEAFGRITIEGMLAGNLVIGTNSGGTKEIIQNEVNGYLYTPGNEKELVDVLIKVIENQNKAKEIALNGQNRAKSSFSDVTNAENIMKIYNTLII